MRTGSKRALLDYGSRNTRNLPHTHTHPYPYPCAPARAALSPLRYCAVKMTTDHRCLTTTATKTPPIVLCPTQLCHSLMNKAVHFKATGQSFGVTSVVVPAGTKGFLYLEAKNEPAVKAAINGLRGVRVNI